MKPPRQQSEKLVGELRGKKSCLFGTEQEATAATATERRAIGFRLLRKGSSTTKFLPEPGNRTIQASLRDIAYPFSTCKPRKFFQRVEEKRAVLFARIGRFKICL